MNLRFLADALATMRARARNFMARSRRTLSTGSSKFYLLSEEISLSYTSVTWPLSFRNRDV